MKLDLCDKSNSWFKKLESEYKELGASSLGFIKLENNEVSGSMAKLFSEEELKSIKDKFKLENNNYLVIICGLKSENLINYVVV